MTDYPTPSTASDSLNDPELTFTTTLPGVTLLPGMVPPRAEEIATEGTVVTPSGLTGQFDEMISIEPNEPLSTVWTGESDDA